MSVSLVLTVIGDDRPGLVEQLATAVSLHHGNWLESSMSNLSGKFAGIVCVNVPEGNSRPLLTRSPPCPVFASLPRSPTRLWRRPAIGG
jgi:glycine cleavage system regulatory protein